MRKYITVTLVALTVLITIAVNAASAADNTCSRTNVCNVVGTCYECNSWSDEQYPMISLFGEEDVPLLADHDDVWNSHVTSLPT